MSQFDAFCDNWCHRRRFIARHSNCLQQKYVHCTIPRIYNSTCALLFPFSTKNLGARDDSSASLQHLAPERIIFRLERSKRSTLSLNGKKKNEIIKILLKLPLISFEKSIKTFLDFHFKGFGFSFPNTLNCFSRFLNLAHSFWNLKVLQGLGKWTSCLKNCFTRKFT